MLTGRCLCGAIRFEIKIGSGYLLPLLECRRATGSSFATNASVRTENFRILDGHNLIKKYESSPGNRRGFSSKCNTYSHVGSAMMREPKI